MTVQSIGGKRYTRIVRDDYTQFIRVYFLRHKSDASSAFESFLAEVRADGTPSADMAVRSDNGREFFEELSGNFAVSVVSNKSSLQPTAPSTTV